MAWRIWTVVALQAALFALTTYFVSSPEVQEEVPASHLPIIPQKVAGPIPAAPHAAFFAPPLRASGLLKPVIIAGAVEPADSSSFRMGLQLVRLRHIVGPGRNAICLDDSAQRWSCGLQARAALINALRADTAICRPALDAPGEADAFECRVGGEDLSRLMVRSGWARPKALFVSSFANEAGAAAHESSGLWRGGWTIEASPP